MQICIQRNTKTVYIIDPSQLSTVQCQSHGLTMDMTLNIYTHMQRVYGPYLKTMWNAKTIDKKGTKYFLHMITMALKRKGKECYAMSCFLPVWCKGYEKHTTYQNYAPNHSY